MASGNSGSVLKKIVGWVGLLLLLLTAVLGSGWYYASTRDFFFKEISDITLEMAGYELAKSDPLSFSPFPQPTLTAKNLKISNPGLDRNALIADVGELSLTLPWGALLRLQIDLNAVLTAPKVSLDVETDGARNWMTPELEEVTGDLPFDLVRVDTSELELIFRNHQSNEILGLDVHQFDINLREGGGSARVETAGRLGKYRFFLLGEVAQQGPDNHFEVDLDFGAGRARETRVDAIRAPSVSWWIRQNAVLFPLQGAVKGEFALEEHLPSGELEVTLATGMLDKFLDLSDDTVPLKPGIGPLRASGRLVLRGSDVDVRELEARIDQPEMGLELKGSVSNLLSVIESDLVLSHDVRNLNSIIDITELIPWVGTRLAEFPLEARINATVRTRGEAVALEDADIAMGQGTLVVDITGSLSASEDALEYEAKLDVRAPDSNDLTRILAIERVEARPGQMQITAAASGNARHVRITDAVAQLHDGNYRAAVDGTVDLSGEQPVLDLTAQLEIKDAAGLRSYTKDLPAPMLQQLAVSAAAEITGPVDNFALRNVDLNMAHDKEGLHVIGEAAGLPGDPEVAADFSFTLRKPLELDQFFPKLGPQRLMSPLDLTGSIGYADQHLALEELALSAEKTNLGGLIDIDFSRDPAQIVILMDAQEFHTRLVEPDSDSTAETAGQEGEPDEAAAGPAADEAKKPPPDQGPGKLFQEFTNGIEIETDWIHDLDLYLSFTADRARLSDYDIEALDVIIDARNGMFTLANYEITLHGRPMSLQGYINANTSPPSYLFNGDMEGETLEALLNLEEQILEGGELSGNFFLMSEGNTLGDLIKSLDGQALLEMGPLTIRSSALDLVSSDIFSSMLGGITRSKENRKSTRYQCGVLGIDVRRGIARINKSFTLQARDYNLAGKGEVDLNTGYVELVARPKAKKGLGISLSSMIGGFRVEGHVATPKFGVGGGGLVSAAVVGYALTPTMAAAAANPATATIVATGFFAKGIFDRLTASSYSCRKTLERIERNRRRQVDPRSPRSGRMDL